MKKIRVIGTPLAAATLFATLLTAQPAPAAAAPSGCTTGRSTGNTTWAECTSGTGQYRAYTWCDISFARDYKRYGPWRSPGEGRSIAACNSSDYAYDYGYATLS